MFARQHHIGIALVIAAVFLAGCAGASSGIRPVIAMDGDHMNLHDPVENGRALLMTGQYGLAIDALSRVLHDDPKNARTLTLLAEAYDRLHRYDLADRYHDEALQADPNFVAALNNWGYSFLVRGDKARAVGLLERAAAVKKDHPIVAANLRLAIGEAAAALHGTASSRLAVEPAGDLRLGEHVTLVRRTGTLVRMASGVQMLVTRAPAMQAPQVSSLGPKRRSTQLATLPAIIAPSSSAGSDLTIRLLAALQRILDPSPFKFFPEVDDFARQWQADSGSASEPTRFVAATE